MEQNEKLSLLMESLLATYELLLKAEQTQDAQLERAAHLELNRLKALIHEVSNDKL